MNVQMEPISVITAVLTPLDHTHVAVTLAINSVMIGFSVMVGLWSLLHHTYTLIII